MKFNEAIEEMKKGKKVRRSSWEKYYTCGEFGFVFNSDKEHVLLNLNDLESTDWEIYEEEDNWNLWEEWGEGPKYTFRNSDLGRDIKTLKENILEDMKILNDEEFNYVNIEHILDERFGF